MGIFTKLGAEIWRRSNTGGYSGIPEVPSSGPHNISKSDMRAWMATVEQPATVDLLRIADPAAPGAGIDRLYSGTDGRLRVIEPAGTIALYDRTEALFHALYGGI